MRNLLRALLLAGAACGPCTAIADDAAAHPACDFLVRPDEISAYSGHSWRSAPGIRLNGDVAVCAYYQDEVPGGLSLSVHEDPEQHEFRNAREYYTHVQDADDVHAKAFYFRLASTAPFEPAWGMVLHAGNRTYRVEGVPEAGDAARARTTAREILQRTVKVF